MRVDYIKGLQICHRSATDLLQSTTVTQGQVCGCPLDCFFNPQTLSVSICSTSVADPAMFWAIFNGMEASGRKGMPQGHSRMSYGRATDTKVCKDFTENSNSLIFPLFPRDLI